MDQHSVWLSRLYHSYECREFPYESSNSNEEVNLEEIVYRSSHNTDFDQLWLDEFRLPPLLKRQLGKII